MGSTFVPSIARRVHRGTGAGAAIALPTGGTVTTLADSTTPPANDYPTGAFQVPAGITRVTFWLTYTRGAANGAMAFNVMAGNGTESASIPVIDQTINPGTRTGFGTEAEYPWSVAPPAPSGASPLVYPPFTVEVQPGWSLWLQATEVGVTATPGSLLVALTGAPS